MQWKLVFIDGSGLRSEGQSYMSVPNAYAIRGGSLYVRVSIVDDTATYVQTYDIAYL
jgi:hypothetical protein